MPSTALRFVAGRVEPLYGCLYHVIIGPAELLSEDIAKVNGTHQFVSAYLVQHNDEDQATGLN